MPHKSRFIFTISCAVLVLIAWVVIDWCLFLYTPLVSSKQQPVSFLFSQGMSAKTAATRLHKLHLLKRPWMFVVLTRLSGYEHNLKAGEYQIDPGMKPQQLLYKMAIGDAIRHEFTIVEGWTFNQVITALNSNPYLKHSITNLKPDAIMATIGHPGELPEGRFAPDTFLFSGDVTDTALLVTAYELMQKRLQIAWVNKATNAPYHCPYQALVVASLIEKETAVEQEKPIIAGVILRRLAKDMLLQIDSTVIYGLGAAYTGKLTYANLATDTSYNTYLHKGLPPTPISMPSPSSIEAALHPRDGTVIYYAAKGDGTHIFANTLVEQNRNVAKYIKKIKP